jgi:phosphopentomutase
MWAALAATSAVAERDFHGICFTNLVDFDMVYGHRNNVEGYAAALTEFDRWLTGFLPTLRENDLLIITADHGCDPSTPSTDHSREYTPMLMYGKSLTPLNLGTRTTFADIAATVLDFLGLSNEGIAGESML